MITSDICIVNGISSQKPLPHASTIPPIGVGVATIATETTITVAISAKMNASGIQRSLNSVSASASRAIGPGRSSESLDGEGPVVMRVQGDSAAPDYLLHSSAEPNRRGEVRR